MRSTSGRHAAALQAIERVGEEAAERERLERQAAERPVTVREVAHEWLEWLRDVKRVKPATLRDYETLLREPGTPYPRGTRVSAGRLLAAFGDTPIQEVRTRDVSTFLRRLDAEGLTPRNVNKHRQVLGSIFQYACREDTYDLPVNPVARTDKRPEPPPAALDYYEEHEVEALVETIAAGRHRTRERDALDERIDAQDAEMLRVLFYTGTGSARLSYCDGTMSTLTRAPSSSSGGYPPTSKGSPRAVAPASCRWHGRQSNR